MRTTGDPNPWGRLHRPAYAGPLAFVLLLAGHSRAEVEIPTVGQPTPFYGAAGSGVKVEASAEPTELSPDDAILYTLTVRNLLNPTEVQRPDLSELEAFRRDFQVEDDPTPESEPAGTRVFWYRLRPRGVGVTRIPELVFPFYNPNVPQPPDRPDLPFQKARTQPIPIRVRPTPPPPQAMVPLEVPAFAESLDDSSGGVPAWVWWLAAVGPPVLAVGWCVGWRALNPAGARLARRRRSRAARHALRTLHALGRHPPADPGAVVGCVAAYLAERFDLPGLFRTPADLTRRLTEAGASAEAVAECEAFLRAADVARFAPSPAGAGDALATDAEHLVRRLEGEA